MNPDAIISFSGIKEINAEIALTGSKSESNRALILAALAGGRVKVNNLSDAADTRILQNILEMLNKNPENDSGLTIDVGHAGTAMRFLTAYLSTIPGQFLLTGSGRMKERPVQLLAEALKTLGANISYAGKEGYPPLNINGKFNQLCRKVSIPGNISSQYLSALLMVAPSLPLGLALEIEGELTSKPYLEMTLKMMGETGIEYQWENNTIHINYQAYPPGNLTIEPDWSACSYWYSIAALADHAGISLPNLKEKSLQGDSRIQEIMQLLGVTTTRKGTGIHLDTSTEPLNNDGFLDLKDCPDLAQTIIVCAAAKGLNLRFTGLETLKIKETNRINALQNELLKIGVKLHEKDEVYTLDCRDLTFPERVQFKTYDDHRMAMAFAPLALRIKEVEIEDHQVVEKSYPDFWKDLQKAGFTVNER